MDTFSEFWEQAKLLIKEDVTAVAMNTWINYMTPVSLTAEKAFFTVPQQLHKDIISSRYREIIERRLEEIIGFSVELALSLAGERREEPSAAPVAPPAEAEQTGGRTYTFDNFIVGNSNKFAHAAAKAAAEQPGSLYNPLFIHGGSGLGKTHLLYAIVNSMEQRFPNWKITYVSADDFSNQLIEAINNRTTAEFRNKYRLIDVLLIDDVQFLGRTEATQEEVFHTFNALYAAKKQIVLTSDRPPKEIATLEDRLRTRFEQGLLADVQPPDYETRCAILRRKADNIKINLSPEVIEFIATKLKSNIRQLEGAVKKIKVSMLLSGQQSSIAMAEEAIRDMLSESEPVSVTVDRIISEVAEHYKVAPEDIRGTRRSADIVLARQVAMYLTREITGMPYSFIADSFGGKNHTTVMYSISKIEEEMKENLQLRSLVGDLKNNYRER